VIWRRALAVWFVLLLVESAHGTVRRLVLEPRIGDFQARQISVFTGSLLILFVTYLVVNWIGASTAGQLFLVGLGWVLLTFSFEIGIGRSLGYSWERVLSDFDLPRGGLLGIGLVIMGLAPLITSRLRKRLGSSI
jgi:hypothetical protein